MNFKDFLLATLLGVFFLIPSTWASAEMNDEQGGGDGGDQGGPDGGEGE